MTDQTNPAGRLPAPSGCCRNRLDRRQVLGGLIGAASAVAVGPAFGADKAEDLPAQEGDFLVSALGRNPLGPDNVRLNAGPLEAWAFSPAGVARRGNPENMIYLFRFDPAAIPADLRAKCPEGVVALSATCTHSGCPAADYNSGNGILTCQCHGSQFMPKEGGKLVHGPAVRKLPQLALALKDGKFVVSGPFDGKVGGDFPAGEDH